MSSEIQPQIRNKERPSPYEFFIEILQIIDNNSGKRARIAFQEADQSTFYVPKAGLFLKIDECRFGRDMSKYAHIAEKRSWKEGIFLFSEEVLAPVQSFGFEESYNIAVEEMLKVGESVLKRKSYEELKTRI